ncbi:MAG: YhbY family RNA-binding protein [Candidatus Ventricola sp.]
MVKGTVLQNCPLTAREAIAALCEGAHAEPVQCIGSRFVIYRAREKDPKIVLP